MYLRGCYKFSCLTFSFTGYKIIVTSSELPRTKHGTSGVGPAESSKDDGVTGTSLLWGKTEEAGPAQS